MAQHTSINLSSGAVGRDQGIKTATQNAENNCPGWTDEATQFLLAFLKPGQRFLCEDVRAFAADHGLPDPPSSRAWGGVMVSAARSGIIKQVGYGRVKNIRAHSTPAAIWEPCVQDCATA